MLPMAARNIFLRLMKITTRSVRRAIEKSKFTSRTKLCACCKGNATVSPLIPISIFQKINSVTAAKTNPWRYTLFVLCIGISILTRAPINGIFETRGSILLIQYYHRSLLTGICGHCMAMLRLYSSTRFL